jgi:apolipoprotein N-acyltransferase
MQRYQQMVFGVANEPDVSVWPESASGIGVYDEIKKELHNGLSKISSKEIEVLFGGYLQEGMFVKNVIFSSMSSKEIYAKQHLVPVGEYIPSWFSLFDVWIPGAFQGSTVAGLDQSSNVLLDKHAVGFTPIICYEVLFNGEIRNKSKRSGLLVVFSDLSAVKYPWVKNYFFNIARIRAMELKKPMLVSSNHGVTGVISGGGGVVERVEGKEDYIFEEIIPSWEETPFLLYGNTLTLFFLLFLFVIGGGLIALYPASYAK